MKALSIEVEYEVDGEATDEQVNNALMSLFSNLTNQVYDEGEDSPYAVLLNSFTVSVVD